MSIIYIKLNNIKIVKVTNKVLLVISNLKFEIKKEIMKTKITIASIKNFKVLFCHAKILIDDTISTTTSITPE